MKEKPALYQPVLVKVQPDPLLDPTITLGKRISKNTWEYVASYDDAFPFESYQCDQSCIIEWRKIYF